MENMGKQFTTTTTYSSLTIATTIDATLSLILKPVGTSILHRTRRPNIDRHLIAIFHAIAARRTAIATRTTRAATIDTALVGIAHTVGTTRRALCVAVDVAARVEVGQAGVALRIARDRAAAWRYIGIHCRIEKLAFRQRFLSIMLLISKAQFFKKNTSLSVVEGPRTG
jgi:hypothetical protein